MPRLFFVWERAMPAIFHFLNAQNIAGMARSCNPLYFWKKLTWMVSFGFCVDLYLI